MCVGGGGAPYLSAAAQGTAGRGGERSGGASATGSRRGSARGAFWSGAGVPRGWRCRAASAPLSPPAPACEGRTLTAESLGLAEERLRVHLRLHLLRALHGRLRACSRRLLILLLRGAAPLLGRQQLLFACPLQPQPAAQAAQHGAGAAAAALGR